MKSQNQFLILIALTCMILTNQILKAQNSNPAVDQGKRILSGDSLKSEDVVSKADAIFVGEVINIGIGNTKAAGRSTYFGVQLRVLQVFRGALGARVTVTLRTTFKEGIHELPPEIGTSYIFFAQKSNPGQPDPLIVLKILPATAENLAKVKQLSTETPLSR